MPELERELDDLYALPAEEFTAARNELAKRLRAAGQTDEADEVKALRRPSAPAAVVNRLARERPKQVAALMNAGEALREAHAQGGDALRKAAERERRAVDALVDEARGLEPAPSDATLARVGSTLRAAAGDPAMQPLLERGRLTADVEPGGFDALAGIAVAAPSAPQPAKPKPDRRKLEQERALVRDLREAAAAASRAASDARRAAERAARKLEQAEARLRKLESE